MARTLRREDDDDAFEIIDGKKVLKDGGRLTVKTTMRDSQERITDAAGKDGHGLHRPGFRLLADDVGPVAKAIARDEYEEEITNAWRNPPTGAGSSGPRGQRSGDTCTINGYPGHLEEDDDGKFVCVPDRQRKDAATSLDELYRRRDFEDANAWRTKP